MSLFNYSRFDVSLNQTYRNLRIELQADAEGKNHIDLEMLFELESLLSWCLPKVEIHSILITTKHNHFSEGIDRSKLLEKNMEQIEKLTRKLQLINHLILQLPQTVIVDLKKGARNLGTELALSADIKICHHHAKISLDHANLGMAPASGGVSLVNTLIGSQWSRNWILMNKPIVPEQLTKSGFIYNTYHTEHQRQELTASLLQNIREQAQVARIQGKLACYLAIKDELEEQFENERKTAKATLMSGDWREKNKDYMRAKSMGESVKLTLIHSEQKDKGFN